MDSELKAMTAGWGNLTFPEDGLGGENGEVRPVDHRWKTGGGSDTDDDRKKNQKEAFKQVYGRAPTSPSDWEMATALDPHTYTPDFKWTQAEVRVVRINPVPGQGVVRASQWIPQRDVTTPGHVKVGVPQDSVTQIPGRSGADQIRRGEPIRTGSHNKYLRAARWPLGLSQWWSGFHPGTGGVHVDGTRTNYPSMEVYQDMPNGTTRTVLIDPARSGSGEGRR